MSMPAEAISKKQFRDVHLNRLRGVFEYGSDGTLRVHSPDPLGPYPEKLTERLDHWAKTAPDRVFLAQRAQDGAWRTVTYGAFRAAIRNIAQALLDRNLSAERPVAILSGNDLEHALLAYGAMYAGIPHAPISPSYALASSDFGKLRHVLSVLTPGLIFATNGAAFERALRSVTPHNAETVVLTGPAELRATPLAELTDRPATSAVDTANRAITPDSIAKFLFTSGSTGFPKGVINTQRMLCSNQQMLLSVLAFLADEPPVFCDWLPWNHTFGGNHNVGIIIYNGGTLYIDDGKPVPGAFEETIRNLRDVAPTVYFNVPKGYEMLAERLRREPALARHFFSRLKLTFYSAAGLPQHIWDALDDLAIETVGERIVMLTGLGSTETAPFAICVNPETSASGVVGLPAPGIELKLAPVAGKLEARLRGPNITPGYWRSPEATAIAFDEEGFYRLGDALVLLDPNNPGKGFCFDGRVAEDFKLSTGTWVSVGPLRATLTTHCAPYVKDVVIAAPDRDYLCALIFPDVDACRALCPDLNSSAAASDVLAHPRVRSTFQALLEELAKNNSGSSTRIRRAILMHEPLSVDAHEITDKGSINQRAVLTHRAALIEELYSPAGSARIIPAVPSVDK